MIQPWNSEKNNIANEQVRVVKFYFETSDGPGEVTAVVNKGVSIEEAKRQMIDAFKAAYENLDPLMRLEITKYEILHFLNDINDIKNLGDLGFDDFDDFNN
jgi:hypothetical protein